MPHMTKRIFVGAVLACLVPGSVVETRPQVETVLDDARKINQVMVRGKYGTQAERYWGVLRTAVNDLARCYNLTPLGV